MAPTVSLQGERAHGGDARMTDGPRIGVVFPQTDFDPDPAFARDFAQAAEDLGFTHLLAYDHVLGAVHEGREPKLVGPYTELDPFREPFVLFGFLAGLTSTIEFGTAVLVLPQRQTALVAKQAAEVDILSNGRLRLGVGVGWNHVEYEALNEEWARRGARSAEQVELLRLLWSEEVVDYEGSWHRIDRASIFPRPGRRIPIWFGGFTDAAFRRAARLGDGFFFSGRRQFVFGELDRLRARLREDGRDESGFGFEAFVEYDAGPDGWIADLDAYGDAGFTHLSLRTIPPRARRDSLTRGAAGFQAHIDALSDYAAGIDLTSRR